MILLVIYLWNEFCFTSFIHSIENEKILEFDKFYSYPSVGNRWRRKKIFQRQTSMCISTIPFAIYHLLAPARARALYSIGTCMRWHKSWIAESTESAKKIRGKQKTIQSSSSCKWSHIFWLINSHSRLFIKFSLKSVQLNVDKMMCARCAGVKNDFFPRRWFRMKKRNSETISEHSIRVYQHIISRCVDVFFLSLLFFHRLLSVPVVQLAVAVVEW